MTTSMMIVTTPRVILSSKVPYAVKSFLHIMHKLGETSPYFTERHDVTSHIGLTPLQ
jgi:hypothetical protein